MALIKELNGCKPKIGNNCFYLPWLINLFIKTEFFNRILYDS